MLGKRKKFAYDDAAKLLRISLDTNTQLTTIALQVLSTGGNLPRDEVMANVMDVLAAHNSRMKKVIKVIKEGANEKATQDD